ncbi:competence protein ComK [Sporosarcina sp. 179-K 3D1 HS]|uniref:competence protein ComK n=1 Tax=Sporosarcina sp. 179-K 3D1 HS TaxID=3232169 RepID=UPI0039A0251B
MIRTEFVLTHDTAVFLPMYDGTGKLCTLVMENGEMIEVAIKPNALMDRTLQYYGSSLQGASDGAKYILGNTQMNPVWISDSIIWFPSKSAASDDCVWLALHHVERYVPCGKEETEVTLSTGSKVVIKCSYYSFDKKVQRAYKLKGTINKRLELSAATVVKENIVCYSISKEENSVHYEIKSLD